MRQRARAEIHGKVRIAHPVIVKILFDDLALVAERQKEVLAAVARVPGHDVPEDRTPADLDHRFRLEFCFFAQSRAFAAAKDDDVHRIS